MLEQEYEADDQARAMLALVRRLSADLAVAFLFGFEREALGARRAYPLCRSFDYIGSLSRLRTPGMHSKRARRQNRSEALYICDPQNNNPHFCRRNQSARGSSNE